VHETRIYLRCGFIAAILCLNAAISFAVLHYLFLLSAWKATAVALAVTAFVSVVGASSFMSYIRGDHRDFIFTVNPNGLFTPKVAFWLMAPIAIPVLASVIRLGLFLLAIPVGFGLGLVGLNLRSLVEPITWTASTVSFLIALLAWGALWRRFKRDLAADPT